MENECPCSGVGRIRGTVRTEGENGSWPKDLGR